jgi:hypothetical protein
MEAKDNGLIEGYNLEFAVGAQGYYVIINQNISMFISKFKSSEEALPRTPTSCLTHAH